MYEYAKVEAALAHAFSITPRTMGGFRARIQNFQRLRWVPASPGTGRKVSYPKDHVYKWALGLEFVEFGADPRHIKLIVDMYAWRWAAKYLLSDTDVKDALLLFYPNMLFGFSAHKEEQIVIGLPCVVVKSLAEVGRLLENPQTKVTGELLSDRLGMINLARLRRVVEEGLASDQSVASAPRRKKEEGLAKNQSGG
jgi:hypothetical protein